MSLKKILTVGGLTVGAGALLTITGGLAAPAIGGAIGSLFLGLSGAAATSAGLAAIGGGSLAAGGFGMAGGAAIVSSTFGLLGGGIMAKNVVKLTKELREFDFRPIGGNSLHIMVGVSGFLSQKTNVEKQWAPLRKVFGNAECYALRWESQALGSLAGAFAAEVGKRATRRESSKSSWSTTIATSMSSALENSWSLAKERATHAGMLLAECIENRHWGARPISLAGFSLGTRVILEALSRLAQKEVFGVIDSVYLLGGAVAKDDAIVQSLSSAVISGTCINAYSRTDQVLSRIFPAAELFRMPIGSSMIDTRGVVNIDVTELVGGHLQYAPRLGHVLRALREVRP